MATIDLNCDLGESFGRWTLGDDEAMLDLVSSANIACGFHAGDPSVMRRTVAAAKQRGVGIGAHPGYADLRGFGRVALSIPAQDLANDVLYQIGALGAICRAEGAELRHVKPHGALYNALARDADAGAGAGADTASAVIEAVAAYDVSLALLLPARSPALEQARAAGLRAVAEAFVDRAYRPDGTLVPRSEPDSVISDPDRAADRAVRLAETGEVEAVDGSVLELHPDTLCLHGDTPRAWAIAERVRAALEAAGISVTAFD